MNSTARFFNVLVNIPDVDEALTKLMILLDHLQVAVLNNEDWPLLENQFKLVGAVSIRVFRREEEAMELCGDRGAHSHKSAHQKYLKTLQAIRANCEKEGPSVALAQDLRNDVIRWLADHHQIMNASLGRVVKDKIERSIAYHESTIGATSSHS